ncbi:MAG TPA: hypothetical protein PLT65_00195 [Bacilli bacterium]|nr:hypothetical protein [Bacilli bacterium]
MAIVSLKEYIDNVKNDSFLHIMKKVDIAMDKKYKEGLVLIDINLNQINIDTDTKEIGFPIHNLYDPLEKTIASSMTGVSVLADRKSSREHNKISFALMIMGWYVNEDQSAIKSDLEVNENYNLYIEKVPIWIRPYFNEIFRKMNSDINFHDFYDVYFIGELNKKIDMHINKLKEMIA